MKTTTPVNSEGRIAIPAGIRKETGIMDGDILIIENVSPTEIIITRQEPKCSACGATEEPIEGLGKIQLCANCIATLKTQY